MGTPAVFEADASIAAQVLETAHKEKREVLSQPESYAILEAYGFPAAQYQVAHSKEAAMAIAKSIGFPVAMKIISKEIIHKFDWGAVAINLKNEQAAGDAYDKIIQNVRTIKTDIKIDGVLMQEMVKGGREIIIGAVKNDQYGHLLMFGFGGTFVEVFNDVTFRLAPLTPEDAWEMINGIQSSKLLEGYRGQPAVDKKALVNLLLRLSQLVTDFPQITELDMNPVLALEKGAKIADAGIVVEPGN